MKAQATLDWLDSCNTEVMSHSGAAFPERELLRLILAGASGVGGVMSAAYRKLLEIKTPSLIEREDARGYAHDVMFGSDFGLDPIIVPKAIGSLLDEAVVIHSSDTDTLGELLMAAHLVGHKSDVIDQYQAVFDSAWLAIPREFENYHPIVVGGILYALAGA